MIRAIAIIMVVIAHSFCLIQRLSGAPSIAAFIAIFDRYIINLGPIGVELFFVLSGFLIGGILIKVFDNTDFKPRDVGQFWLRRWFRTLPNYWLILTANFLIFRFVKGNQIDPANYSGYIFLQNLVHPNTLNIFPEGWSLSVEEWFYITLPIVMLVASAIFRPVNKQKFLFRTFIGYLGLFLIIRVVNAIDPINGIDPDDGIRKVVVFRLDAVMYGVLMAYFIYFHKARLALVSKRLFTISILGSLLLYYFIVKFELAYRSQPQPIFRYLSNAFLYMVIPLVFSLSLPYAASVKEWSNKWLSGIIKHISKISYSLYLVHFSLFIPWLCSIKVHSAIEGLGYYISYWTAVITLSSLLYTYFESPVMKLRDRISEK